MRRTRNLAYVLGLADGVGGRESRRARSMPSVQPLLELAIRAELQKIDAEFGEEDADANMNPRTPSLSGLKLFAHTPMSHNKNARGFARSRKGSRVNGNLCAPKSFGLALIADLLKK